MTLIADAFGFGAGAAAMGIFEKVGPAATHIGKFALGGPVRQVMTGALIGGVAGGLSSDKSSPTQRFGDIIGGAAIGAAGMGLAFGIGRRLTNLEKAKGLGKLAWGGAKMGARALPYVGGVGLRVGAFALNNPRSALLLGGAGLGLSSLAMSGASSSGSNEELAARAREQGSSTGFIPGMGGDFRALQNSTNGLVQGMHAGRHRG